MAAVLAANQSVARRAAGLVSVEYQDLPAVFTIEVRVPKPGQGESPLPSPPTRKCLHSLFSLQEAIAAQSYLQPPAVLAVGDADRAEAEADHVADGEVRSAGQEHFYLETQAGVAVPREDGEVEVTASTQSPSGVQETIARVLGVPKSRVVVKVKRLGGGFGGKESRVIPFSVLIAISASKYVTVRVMGYCADAAVVFWTLF